ncbi:hypothetical protein G7Z17_g2635 [Cylindrodendrum hubeiense]|uniref:Apple domain-containing protein n=1 Tax=Cylindrodendrum hubeiense TaxID=595255 RepID=A0A9P5HJA4_9HYPO|nr:hypothetical protein G7Z17_g2635 [Cylindrodendrum hubeiense]
MRSVVTLAALALSGAFHLAGATPCKPSNTLTSSGSTSTPSSTPVSGPIKNLVGNGNLAIRDPDDPTSIPGYTITGQAELNVEEGYVGDGSTDRGCAELQVSDVSAATSKHKRAIGSSAGISQQITGLDTTSLYTVRFFYAVITAPASLNVCWIDAYLGTQSFFNTFILSPGLGITYGTVLTQTTTPSVNAAISIAIHCSSGGVAAVYIDSIFVSNKVTPQNINDYELDYGDASDVPAVTTTAPVESTALPTTPGGAVDDTTTGSSQSTTSDGVDDITTPGPLSTTDAGSVDGTTTASSEPTPSGNVDETTTAGPSSATIGSPEPTPSNGGDDAPTTSLSPVTTSRSALGTPGPSSSADVNTSQAGSQTDDGSLPSTPGAGTTITSHAASQISDASLPGTPGADTTSTPHAGSYTTNSDGSASTPGAHTTTSTSLTTTTTTTSSAAPTDTDTCPQGISPPGGCRAIEGLPTQKVSLPGIDLSTIPDGTTPQAPRTCGAYGVKKNGYWGRTRQSNTKQNTLDECAALCKEEDNCVAFALYTYSADFNGGNTCALSNYRLAIDGIDLNRDFSIMWNDLDCYECFDCNKLAPGTTPTETDVVATTTTAAPVTTTSSSVCLIPEGGKCTRKSPTPNGLTCSVDGHNFSAGFGYYRSVTSEEECAAICAQDSSCKSSGWQSNANLCRFQVESLTDLGFTPVAGGETVFSDPGCWDCPCQSELTTTTTTTAPATTTSASVCLIPEGGKCTRKSPTPSGFTCSVDGHNFSAGFGYYRSVTSEEECAAICAQDSSCKSSGWQSNANLCRFQVESLAALGFTPVAGGETVFSDPECWDCPCQSELSPTTTAAPDSTTTVAPGSTTTAPPNEDATSTTTRSTTTSSELADRPECTLAVSDGCSEANPDEMPYCSQTGHFAETFTLEVGDYPWYYSWGRCDGLCYHMPSRCKAFAYDYTIGKCRFSSHSIYDSSFSVQASQDDDNLSWSEQACYTCPCAYTETSPFSATTTSPASTTTTAPAESSSDSTFEPER